MKKKDRKYIRDAKGRFAEVPDTAPAPAKFFSQFTPEEAKALLNQQKRDRAQARKAKAALTAAAEKANKNLDQLQADPNFKPFAGNATASGGPQAKKTAASAPETKINTGPGVSEPVKAPFPSVFPVIKQGAPVYAGNTSVVVGHHKPTKVYKVKGSTHPGFKYKSDAVIHAQNLQAKQQALNDADFKAKQASEPAEKPAPAFVSGLAEYQKLKAEKNKPVPDAPEGEKMPAPGSDAVTAAQKALDAAKAANDPAAAKKARAALRRAKAKQEASSKGQNVTFADEQKPAAPKAAPKGKATAAEQQAQADYAEAAKRVAEINPKLQALRSEKWSLKNSNSAASIKLGYSGRYKRIREIDNEIMKLEAEKTKADSDKLAARIKINSEKAKRGVGSSKVGAAEKAKVDELTVKEKQLKAKQMILTTKISDSYIPTNGVYHSNGLTQGLYKERDAVYQQLKEVAQQKKEAQAELDKVLGKLDVSSDVTNESTWTPARKMKASISAMNAKYEKDDPAWRKKVGAYGMIDESTVSPNRQKAHQDYTHATYRLINNALRDSTDGTVPKKAGEVGGGYGVNSGLIDNYWSGKGGLPKLIDELSGLINEDGYKTEEPVTVMRGIRGNASYHPGEIYQEGAIVEEKAYTSVTVSKSIQASFAKPRGFKGDNSSWSMYIRLPAGTNYAHGNRAEREMILDKGTKFKVLKVDKTKNEIYLARVD